MQLKLRRSQREGGIVSAGVIFCLDARADLTEQERSNLARYKLYNQVIYNSEAAKRSLDKSVAATNEGSAAGLLKGVFHLAMTALRLNVTIRSLEHGHHIECKSMDELVAAEDAIMQACQNLKMYLEVAATFDGSEIVVDFSSGQPEIVSQAIRPEPILAPRVAELTSAPPALELPAPEPPPVALDDDPMIESEPAVDDYDAISETTWRDDGKLRIVAFAVALIVPIVLFMMLRG